ncbi:glycoside hydrolase family 20 [Micractinium conductrix]|uniref:beta-N-acetylhexosaminidase n=1 Tax=Micractinium conductrix TaxID=554055 RepID=A0A2P6V860_9CHLO|nr:glycoside hydrolase family 20 [Micractinium conductrix]|eukprot:PSC70268.1 glycoside hydrolase family 20 [Micractinium conductrix]
MRRRPPASVLLAWLVVAGAAAASTAPPAGDGSAAAAAAAHLLELEAPLWPAPLSYTHDCSGAALDLRGAQLSVKVVEGDAAAAERVLADSFEAGRAAWACGGAAASKGPAVRITVLNASCTSPACSSAANDESYRLTVGTDGVGIEASALFGAQWALASLTSLADARCSVACLPVEVDDRPRFPHRGVLLDTARNWFSVADIKAKVINPMARTKLNVLHWHVWDSQSQPLEIKFNASFWLPYSQEQRYTQEDARDLIDYAFTRGIRVLPEFDMPGHTAVFAKADPSLVACADCQPWDGQGQPDVMCNQPPCGQLKPEAVGVAKQLLTELAALFPSGVVSTGADEVNFNCWNNATVVPQQSSDYPAHQAKWTAVLEGFQAEVASTLAAAGKQMAVWDESFSQWGLAGTPALPNGLLLFAWSSPEAAAAMTDAGYQVVMAPWRPWYLDCGLQTKDSGEGYNWCSPLNTWQDIYSYDPLANGGFNGTAGDPSLLLGGEVAMWSEHLRPSVLDYVVWPRAAALAERLWSPAEETQDAAAAEGRLRALMRQLGAAGLRVSPLDWQGTDFKFELLPQWCDTAGPQLDSAGADYCGPATSYRGVPLTFENLVEASEAA